MTAPNGPNGDDSAPTGPGPGPGPEPALPARAANMVATAFAVVLLTGVFGAVAMLVGWALIALWGLLFGS